jgi:Ca-activated chloride channel homolog
LHGTAQARVIVKLYHNGAHIAEREAAFTQSGKQTIRFAQHLATAGFHQYTSVLEGLDGTSINPNEGGTVVYAYGRPKVLYVATSSGPTVLRDILVRHDFEVDFASPAFLPTSAPALSPYDAVIFDNVPAAQVTGKQMQTIAEHVETFGGGFIMMGGAQSFGPGGYAQTALEKILPVEMRVRSREERPPLSVVLLLDKSGSMATEQGSRAKIDVAKEAVSALLSVLEPDDAIGVIAFDKEARAVVELQPLANKASVQASLQSIQAGGGTAIYPALDLAYHWLRWVDPSKKHVLLLSDGQTEAADFPALMRRLAAAHMVLSAVGIGADVDRAFLQDLAATGNGRAYFTDVMAEVPAIFAREASLMAGKWLIERHFTPYAMADHEIFAGIDVTKLPGMAGYVASTPKPRATMLLVSDSHEPILAGWRFGLGRTLALTSDLSSSWTRGWLRWASFGTLWTHMVRWTSRRLPSDRLHPRVTFAGDTAILGVDAFEGDGRFINFLDMRATIQAPGATQQEIRLAQTASGRYEGLFDVGRKGTYWLSVLASVGAGTSDHAVHFGLHVSTLPEYQTSRTNLTLLTELARITNGAILTREDSPFRRARLATAYIDVWPFPAAAALLLFVLEVAVRRGFHLPFRRR